VDHVLGHQLILVASAAAICALSLITGLPAGPSSPDKEEATAVLVVAPRADTSRSQAHATPGPVPRDRETLILGIQRQLKRLSCYDGAVDGKWTPQLRAAIKVFADQVNAKLPVDRPDYILLRLAEAHEGRVCGAVRSKSSPPSSPSLVREGRVPAGDARLH
jgi:hypothetical protein